VPVIESQAADSELPTLPPSVNDSDSDLPVVN
jgi:hypothetical protein